MTVTETMLALVLTTLSAFKSIRDQMSTIIEKWINILNFMDKRIQNSNKQLLNIARSRSQGLVMKALPAPYLQGNIFQKQLVEPKQKKKGKNKENDLMLPPIPLNRNSIGQAAAHASITTSPKDTKQRR